MGGLGYDKLPRLARTVLTTVLPFVACNGRDPASAALQRNRISKIGRIMKRERQPAYLPSPRNAAEAATERRAGESISPCTRSTSVFGCAQIAKEECHMTPAEACRENANLCLRWAVEATTEEKRIGFIELARDWNLAAMKLEGCQPPMGYAIPPDSLHAGAGRQP
jgi:hypothetical protein